MVRGSSAKVTSERFNETHLAVVDAVDYYLNSLGPKKRSFIREIFDQHHYPDELNDAMVSLGLFGALIPACYGGTEAGLLSMVLAMERFSAFGLGNTLALLITMDTMAILTGASESMRRRFLPKIASGEIKTAFAITEPGAGTNSFELTLSAKAASDGTEYVLSGEKAWITGVDRADYVLVVARTTTLEEIKRSNLKRSFGLTLFLVPTNASGLSKVKMSTVGVEGYNQFQLFFDNVEVSSELVLGEVNHGASVLFSALNPERIVAAAMAVGSVDYFVNKAIKYAKERVVFGGRSIAHYQSLQHPLARIRTTQEGARLLTYEAAQAFDRGTAPQEVGTYANMAKYLASEVAFEAIDRSLAAHGGTGFVLETEIVQMLASTRLSKTAPINNEMVLNYIAETELGLPRSY